MEWKNAGDFPVDHGSLAHKHKLLINTETFGTFLGFFKDGKYMLNYGCEILDVIHWLELPEPPHQK